MPVVTFFKFGKFVLVGVFLTAFLTWVALYFLLVLQSLEHNTDSPHPAGLPILLVLSLSVAIPVWIWGWLAGFFPFHAVRRIGWIVSANERFSNAAGGLIVALIASVPVWGLLLDDQGRPESSGVTVAAVAAILFAMIIGPLFAIYLFRPGYLEQEPQH